METNRYPILDGIDSLEDFRKVPDGQLPELASEIRSFMIENVSKTGGHLASSLGAVELILAMHRVFHSPEDRLLFDVGHQAYAHKILTGRRSRFHLLRQQDGISGFPKREESEHDRFDTGHATTSISAALGMARAMKLRGDPGCVAALIGDGAMTGGMAYEAMNDAGNSKLPLILILNDNGMSISQNVGSMHQVLTRMRISRGYVRFKRWIVRSLDSGAAGQWLTRHMFGFKTRIKNFLLPNQLFEEIGFTYFGPIDGHSIPQLIHYFERARDLRLPVVVHCITQKGKGYSFSEDDPEKFHGIAPFNVDTGLVESAISKSNSAVFADALLGMAGQDARICAISAAMPSGTGLKQFARKYPDRFFDVGIAEEHAVTMAAGLAAEGMRPVVAIYSTFLQRAFDQVLHDVCLMKLPVVLAIDRAGLVGDDGETHQGIYDPAMLCAMPNMTVYSPASQQELVQMLSLAVRRGEPAAVRYNRGSLMQMVSSKLVLPGKWEEICPVSGTTIIATGCMVSVCIPIARLYGTGLVNARTFKPLDEGMLERVRAGAERILVVEECTECLGSRIAALMPDRKVIRLHIPDRPVRQGTVEQQRQACGISPEDIARAVRGEDG